jgi:hypothetical protein
MGMLRNINQVKATLSGDLAKSQQSDMYLIWKQQNKLLWKSKFNSRDDELV